MAQGLARLLHNPATLGLIPGLQIFSEEILILLGLIIGTDGSRNVDNSGLIILIKPIQLWPVKSNIKIVLLNF